MPAILPASTVRARLGNRYWQHRQTVGHVNAFVGNAKIRLAATIPAMPNSLFEALHLSKRYGNTAVVNDLSFAIAPGECLGVIGPNGAGKTTTIRMLPGPDRARRRPHLVPFDGSGQSADARDALAIKAQLGVVGSQMDTLDPDFTVRRKPAGLRTLLRHGRPDPRAHSPAAGLCGAVAQGQGQTGRAVRRHETPALAGPALVNRPAFAAAGQSRPDWTRRPAT